METTDFHKQKLLIMFIRNYSYRQLQVALLFAEDQIDDWTQLESSLFDSTSTMFGFRKSENDFVYLSRT